MDTQDKEIYENSIAIEIADAAANVSDSDTSQLDGAIAAAGPKTIDQLRITSRCIIVSEKDDIFQSLVDVLSADDQSGWVVFTSKATAPIFSELNFLHRNLIVSREHNTRVVNSKQAIDDAVRLCCMETEERKE